MRLFYQTKIILIIILGLFYGQAFAIPSAAQLTQMYRDSTQIPAKQAERHKLFFSVSAYFANMTDAQVENVLNDIINIKKLNNTAGDEVIAPNVVSLYKKLSTRQGVDESEITIVFKNLLQIIKTKSDSSKPSLLSALVNGRLIYVDCPDLIPFIQSHEDFIRDISQYKKYLSFARLYAINLDFVDLSGADLHRANLSFASLVHANLNSANLSGAEFSGADLTSANLYAADLRNSDLYEVILGDTNLENAMLRGAKYKSGTFLGYEHLIFEIAPPENHMPRLINKESEDTFIVNLSMFRRLLQNNRDLSKEITENCTFGALGTMENIDLLNNYSLLFEMFSPRRAGIADIYGILNVEITDDHKEYYTISYPTTTIVSNSFEIDASSFSNVIFTDNDLLPITYQKFKDQIQLNDLHMQKLALSIAASRIGGSPVHTIIISIDRGDNNVLLNSLTIRVKTGNTVVKADYSPLVNNMFLKVTPILPGDYDSVLMKFKSDYDIFLFQGVSNNVELLNKAVEFIKSGNNVNIVKLNNGSLLTDREKLMFVGMVLKLSGNHYFGSSAFGGETSVHISGLVLITQLRSGEIFPGLKDSIIANNLKHHRNHIYRQLFGNNNADECIDSLGGNLIDFLRYGA